MIEEQINKLLNYEQKHDNLIIPWACPIISFGDFNKSRIATIGLNPSDKEFINNSGNKLGKSQVRFPTLQLLGINNWTQVTKKERDIIIKSCQDYFINNPYNQWFKPLDFLIAGTNFSFYFPRLNVCHLDIIPFATIKKWGDLNTEEKKLLINEFGWLLTEILKYSNIELVILNGQSVVNHFEKSSDIKFKKEEQPNWALTRSNCKSVKGYSYVGEITQYLGINLNKTIKVIGYNHNIQSSYGIKKTIKNNIRQWLTTEINLEKSENKIQNYI